MKYGVTHHFQTMAHSLQTDNLNVLVTYQQYKPYRTIIRQYPFQATSQLSMARTEYAWICWTSWMRCVLPPCVSNPCFQSFMPIQYSCISVHGWHYTRLVSTLEIIMLIRENNHNCCQYIIIR